ncbi:DUF1015 domain-containing protein [Aureliella helgolandensis]|uniref:DUF1015 domain-containing protein n=1 Tax=Aureliella helgolandensis TaxID=2527968 RepID=A0A518G5U9_9BACT|nr:DUF1015 domain-containing protein [Aureliella helgolandensis]QDV23967.1 hypothetical protein Q31a_22800 [Aureliella helgolandensis]
MPKIQAFRGLRYNLAQVGELSDVVAPPYDVIDPALQQQLYDTSPYGFVRLELTKVQTSDSDPLKQYERAATLFRQWIRDGVLQYEPDPAIYVYHQVFDLAGTTITRRGFLSRIKLARFGEGNIFPHESTHPKAKEDRLRLTRACKANLSPVFGLYPDAENAAQNLLDGYIADKAALEAHDHLGVTHRLWPVTNQGLIAQVANLIEDKPMFVADGHHRYETACDYRDEIVAANGSSLSEEHPAQFVLSMLMSMDDPGLLVLPTHRLFPGVPHLTAKDLVARLGEYFDCAPAGTGTQSAHDVWKQVQEFDDQGVLGLYTPLDQQWTLVTANSLTHDKIKELAADQSDAWCNLGVSLLHHLIVDHLLEMKDHPTPTYLHKIEEVVEELSASATAEPKYALAAVVMPASIEDIRQICSHHERMPAKSTYFYPKLLGGLVVNPLDGN